MPPPESPASSKMGNIQCPLSRRYIPPYARGELLGHNNGLEVHCHVFAQILIKTNSSIVVRYIANSPFLELTFQ